MQYLMLEVPDDLVNLEDWYATALDCMGVHLSR